MNSKVTGVGEEEVKKHNDIYGYNHWVISLDMKQKLFSMSPWDMLNNLTTWQPDNLTTWHYALLSIDMKIKVV